MPLNEEEEEEAKRKQQKLEWNYDDKQKHIHLFILELKSSFHGYNGRRAFSILRPKMLEIYNVQLVRIQHHAK